MAAALSTDQERWDEKYRHERGRVLREPEPFVLRCLERLGPGAGRRAVDLAAGTGRHALALAERGWEVAAWDVSGVGLELLGEHAARRDLGVVTRVVDLLDPRERSVENSFFLVVLVDFLDRPLWEECAAWIPAGGHLLLSTFTRDWPGTKPPERYRLTPGELSQGREGFESIEISEAGGRAGFLGRRS